MTRPLPLTDPQSRRLLAKKELLVVLPISHPNITDRWLRGWLYYGVEPRNQRWGITNPVTDEQIAAPYKPGDVLPCKEAYSLIDGARDHTGRDPDCVFYRADESSRYFDAYSHELVEKSDFFDLAMIDANGGGWQKPQSMPTWAIRLRPVVAKVECRLVCSITDEEAKCSGVSVLPLQSESDPSAWYETSPGKNQRRTPFASFAADWKRRYRRRGESCEFAVAWGWFAYLRLEKSK